MAEAMPVPALVGEPAVDLYWIPLGAGGHVVRLNGIVFEAVSAALGRRPRRALYHSVLALTIPEGRFTVEMTPVPDADGRTRDVVGEGPVGSRLLAGARIFRYEVRRWRDGVVPDLDHAAGDPVRVTDDLTMSRRIFDLVGEVPTPTWGRDELRAGEMWTCNSIVSWVLTRAGVAIERVPLPPNGRAPGWDAGHRVAGRAAPSDHHGPPGIWSGGTGSSCPASDTPDGRMLSRPTGRP